MTGTVTEGYNSLAERALRRPFCQSASIHVVTSMTRFGGYRLGATVVRIDEEKRSFHGAQRNPGLGMLLDSRPVRGHMARLKSGGRQATSASSRERRMRSRLAPRLEYCRSQTSVRRASTFRPMVC